MDEPVLLPPNVRNILEPSMKLIKRKGTTDEGRKFEDLLTADILLKLTTCHSIENFILSSNEPGMGALDDIVVDLTFTNSITTKYALQLKCGNSQDATLKKNSLQSTTGDFSLQKYFEEYIKLTEKFGPFKIIFCTNRKFSIADKEVTDRQGNRLTIPFDKKFLIKNNNEEINFTIEEAAPEPIFDSANSWHFYRFRLGETRNVVESKRQKYQEYFDNFTLCITAEKVSDIEDAILKKFQRQFCVDDKHSYISKEYLEFVDNWSAAHAKNKLNKSFVKEATALKLLNPFFRELSFSGERNENRNMLKRAISSFQTACFHQDNFGKIQDLWSDAEPPKNVDIDTIRLISKTYQINEGKFDSWDKLSYKDRTKLLWILQRCPLVVVDHAITRQAMKLCEEMKFILLSTKFEDLPTTSTFRVLADLRTSPLYAEIVERFSCHFQGKLTSLRELVLVSPEIEQLVTADQLIQMADDSLQIGEKKMEDLYVNRVLSRNIIRKDFLQNLNPDTIVLIDSVEDVCEFEQSDSGETGANAVHVSQKKCSDEEFSRLCSSFKAKRYHHLRYVDNRCLEWVRSQGDITDLQQLKRCSFDLSDEEENKINLICADPGMGKTTFMDHLRENTSSTHWTILIHARKHSGHLRDANQFQNYILTYCQTRYNSFDMSLLNVFMKSNRIRYVWDGLDELSDKNFGSVKQLIRKLIAPQGSIHWISSRKNLENVLEKEFCVLSRTLRKFNKAEQRLYFQQRLDCSEEKVEEIFEQIEGSAGSAYNILENPMLIFLLTELLITDRSRFTALLAKMLSIAELYDYFIDEKFKKYFVEKEGGDMNSKAACKRFDKFRSKQQSFYEAIAARTYFEIERLPEDCKTFFHEVKDECDELGFIVHVSEENVPEFFHESFGEYFTACHLWKHSNDLRKMADKFFEERHSNVRYFFDLILAKDCEPHTALLQRNWQFFGRCSDEDFRIVDKGGRNLLQVLCSWGTRYPPLDVVKNKKKFQIYLHQHRHYNLQNEDIDTTKLVEMWIKRCSPYDTDKLFNLNSFSYACKASCFLLLAVLTFESKRITAEFQNNICTVLYCSALNDYSDIFRFVEVPDITVQEICEESSFLKLIVELNSFKSLEAVLSNDQLQQKCKSSTELLVLSALKRKFYATARLLIENNCNVNRSDDSRVRPIHLASKSNKDDIVLLLVERGAELNVLDKMGQLPLYIACQNGSHEIANILVQNGAKVNIICANNRTPIHAACEHGFFRIAKLLIENEAQVNIADKNGDMPLHLACKKSHEIVQLLLQHNAKVNVPNLRQETPIHVACTTGSLEMVQLLIKKGANLNNHGPLRLAHKNKFYHIMKLLIENGADIAILEQCDVSIYEACESNCPELMDWVIERGASVNDVIADGDGPLHLLCKRTSDESFRTVQVLVEHKATIDARNKDGDMPIHLACKNKSSEIVGFLLYHRSPANALNNNKEAPIHIACRNGFFLIVRFLVNSKADIDTPNGDGDTPIHLAFNT